MNQLLPEAVKQRRSGEWVCRVFGEHIFRDLSERACRVLEEAVELAQAESVPLEKVLTIVNHVYSKPPGAGPQEAAGAGLALLTYCESAGLQRDLLEERELARVEALPIEHFHARHNAKIAAGISQPRQ